MTLFLNNGQILNYDEVNKVFVENGLLTVSTFKGQYVCIPLSNLSGFEFQYPQSKAKKTFAMFKLITSQLQQQ
jgi:hypothetical protein